MILSTAFQNSLNAFGVSNEKLLLAVSGGIDSVTLCALAHTAEIDFAVAHCNFGLRGEESDSDEAFVQALAQKYGVPFFSKKFDTTSYATEQKRSVQEAARDLRYAWFEEVRRQNGFAYTLLAHHADDNIETMLFNFLRGTGLDGLTGMPAKKEGGRFLRPLLGVRRQEIEAFAGEKGLTWIEDSSNRSNKYSRNFLRNELLPQLKKVFPQVEENLLRNINRFERVRNLYRPAVSAIKKKVCERRGEEVHIPVLKLLQYKDTALIFEIIRDFGFGEGAVDEVIKLASSESGRYIAGENYRIIRHRRWFIIAPNAPTAQTIVIEKEDDLVRFGAGEMRIRRLPAEKVSVDASPAVAALDAKLISYPLVLRKWKAGDYFYPLGMQKKKKLARFFIDQKLSKTDKEKAWVLESHGRIAWVVGHRIDDRFKLTPATKEVLLLTQQP